MAFGNAPLRCHPGWAPVTTSFLAPRPDAKYNPTNESQFRRSLELYLRTLSSPTAASSASVQSVVNDQALTGTTLADVTDAGIAVDASSNYLFEVFVLYETSTTTTGISLAMTCPASPTLFGYNVEIPNLADAGGGDWQGQGTSSGDAVTAPNTPTSSAPFLARIQGILVNGTTAGTLQLQAANETGSSITVKGAVLRLTAL